MALSPDELEQIRAIVRSELAQQRLGFPGYRPFLRGGLALVFVFLGVLALHVVVIGGFTAWHLMNYSH